MFNTDDRPLGSLAEDAYDHLCAAIDPAEGITVEDARAQFREADFPADDADYALDRLLNRGYLYEVDGRLFVTERDETDT
ncbi:hypothetical protein [Halorubrum trueperi]|uniref:MarR family transcriptional regulator n=1 Tax=Halorubrum trueperi TaxID=2004704 RepID=A0ABD5UL04_9EURY